MPATWTGKAKRLPARRKSQGQTASRKQFTFESFTTRIAKLKIHPVARSRGRDDLAAHGSNESTHFQQSLEKWRDMNMSAHFTAFIQELDPLCESLELILFNQDEIVTLLLSHIADANPLSLEPLLSLLSALSHDLGHRFEPYFLRSLDQIRTIVMAPNVEVEVLEWGFETLAWMFHYLSKLLIPNLGPTFDVMMPLLGKGKVRAHIARFAAEAMAFLIRKAANAYAKQPEPLDKIVTHVLREANCPGEDGGYRATLEYGLMTLFAESMKGVSGGLHSSGLAIFEALLQHVHDACGIRVTVGAFVNVLHHCSATSAQPLLSMIYRNAESTEAAPRSSSKLLAASLLYHAATLREGSRVTDWTNLIETICQLRAGGKTNTSVSTDIDVEEEIQRAFLVALANCPDQVLHRSLEVARGIIDAQSPDFSMSSIAFFHRIAPERFDQIIGTDLRSCFHSDMIDIPESCLLLLCLSKPETGRSTSGPRVYKVSSKWMQSIMDPTAIDAERDSLKIYCQNAVLEARVNLSVAIQDQLIRDILGEISRPRVDSNIRKFLLGRELSTVSNSSQPGLAYAWHQITDLSSAWRMPIFIDNVCAICRLAEVPRKEALPEKISRQLINNLRLPSSDLRRSSLRLLRESFQPDLPNESRFFEVALDIEAVTHNHEAVRKINVLINQISHLYGGLSSDATLQPALIYFLFGILTYNLPEIWPTAIDALKIVCDHKKGEELVTALVFDWLSQTQDHSPQTRPIHSQPEDKIEANEFQCFRALALRRIHTRLKDDFAHSVERLRTQFESTHQIVPATYADARMQALRVLKSLPWLAEKKSRQLVPLFLRWTKYVVMDDDEMVEQSSRQERLLALDVFGSFQNPRVLYQSSEAYQALLTVLSSPEAEFQKRALRAIISWKQKDILRLEPVFKMIIDDARFREGLLELSKAMQGENLCMDSQSEATPILLRVLYGRMTASSKRSNTTQISKRRAVFATLSRLPEDVLKEFLEIALSPLDLNMLNEDSGAVSITHFGSLSHGQMIGVLTMVKDMAKYLGDRLLPFNKQLLNVAVVCSEMLKERALVVNASAGEGVSDAESETSEEGSDQIDTSDGVDQNPTEAATDEKHDDRTTTVISKVVPELPDGPEGVRRSKSHHSASGPLRRLGLQCLTTVYERLYSPRLESSIDRIYNAIIYDRIEKLAEETASSVSSLFRLLSVWASDERMCAYLTISDKLLFRILDILSVSTKEEVLLYVLEKILTPFAGKCFVTSSDTVLFLHGHPSRFPTEAFRRSILESCCQAISRDPSKQVLDALVGLIFPLVRHIAERVDAETLLKTCCELLDQPTSRVSPRTKSYILSILQELCSQFMVAGEDFDRTYNTISQLFAYFKDRDNRLKLCAITELIHSGNDPQFLAMGKICSGLNAFLPTGIDVVDHDRRRETYEHIIKLRAGDLSSQMWRPLLYNLVYYVKDTDEPEIGSSAGFALCAFAKLARQDESLHALIPEIILPAIQTGAHSGSEDVRRELLKVMAVLVHELPGLDCINDLKGLLMDDDEEANIFNNLLHIQQHRRIRAVRRLGTSQICAHLRSSNTAYILIPLLEHFIIGREDESKAGDLAAEAITTVGALASALEWHQARRLFMRYLRLVGSKPDLERSILKMLGALTDAITRAAHLRDIGLSTSSHDGVPMEIRNGSNHENGERIFKGSPNSNEKEHFANAGDTIDTDLVGENDPRKGSLTTLSSSLPGSSVLHQNISQNLLPPLTAFLRHKDENVVSLRISAAISAAKLIMLLPPQQISERLPPLLTDISHVLRSRTVESRDLVRKALAEIIRLIGPTYFGFVLRELRNALQRGYQRHVLSYTMHSLLIEAGALYSVGSLDHCLPIAVSIAMDDIFGVVGLEKDAEGYTNKMKEIKQGKSLDSMELLAKIASLQALKLLVEPVQALLSQRLDLKIVKKIDELLRRISSGMLRNPEIEDSRTLVFCYELIQKSYALKKDEKETPKDTVHKRLMINVRGARRSHEQSGSLFGFKMIRFAFDVIRAVVQKFHSLKTVVYLEGFMPAVGDAIAAGEDEVQMSALRLLAAIVRLPLKSVETDGPNLVSAAVNIVKNTANNDSDMAQAALKLVAAVLRDRDDIVIDESDVAYLLKRLQPDLERYDNQGLIFNLLKSVIGREYVIPEVYQVMDVVRAMMVTAQSRETQSMARAVYFQFLTNYPQSELRQQGQITFLGKNLDFPQVDGRKSVLEAIHRLLAKDVEFVQKVIHFLFEPLVFAMVMDDNSECRKMSSLLLGTCFEKAGEESTRLSNFARDWLSKDPASSEKEEIQVRAALQLYAVWVDKDAARIESTLSYLCQHVGELFDSVQQDSNHQWELVFYALQLLRKLAHHFPERVLHKQRTGLWTSVHELISYPHTWVKHASAELLGVYLTEFTDHPVGKATQMLGQHGLTLNDKDAQLLAKRSLKTLQVSHLTVELANLTIRNLAILAHLFKSNVSNMGILLDEGNATPGNTMEEGNQHAKSILELIFYHLSWLIRRQEGDTSSSASLTAKSAALQLCLVLCKDLPSDILTPFVPVILRPVQQLSDPDLPVPFSVDAGFKAAWTDNVALAHDVIEILQKRLGSVAYLKQMSVIQAAARVRREERRIKRRIDAVAAPEKSVSDKRRRHDRTKERRKEKNEMYRQRRRAH